MITSWFLFLTTVFFGSLTIYVGTIFERGGVRPTNLIKLFIDLISTLSFYAVLIWAFINLTWWHVILSAIGTAVLVGFIVTPLTRNIFYLAMPITGLITIISNIFCWMI